MNKMINKLLLARDKFISEVHGQFTKNKEKNLKIKETGG